jgi:3-hydroxyisobutyrate dehydrogenase
MNIGFIGLGNMGSGMAANLLNHCKQTGDRLYVFDINAAAMDQLAAKGAKIADSAKQLAQDCQTIFTSLPSAKQINQIAFGENGILENAGKGTVWLELSTNDPAEWAKVRAAAPSGLTLLDAPVTGGSEGAAAGTLTMLLGGEQAEIQPLEPMLRSFTKRTIRMGPAGAGYVTKLIQLHLNYLATQGIGEALMLGAKASLDLGTLYEVLQNSCAQSYVVDRYVPMVLDGSYDPSFALGLAAKDMRLVSGLGDYLDIDLILADTVYATYQKAVGQFGDQVPHLSVVKLIESQNGRLLRNSK